MILRLPLLSLSVACAVLMSASRADDSAKVLFEDHFERSESTDDKEEIGMGWATNSRSRAAGNKQVDLKDGAMYISIHEAADHAVSVTHPAEFRDGIVELRFMLEDRNDSLGLNFADLQLKEVHAGHLFMTKVSTRDVAITDLKTGNMNLEIREARLNKTVTPKVQAMLKTKEKKFANPLQTGQWHSLKVTVRGQTLTVAIDGRTVGEFSSEGMAHPTKRMLRLSVPRSAVVDDVKISSLD
ncbi:MAG: LamG domain-containing protein [Planctomycetaceae bacterium]